MIIRAVRRTARSLAAPVLGLALALGQAGTGFAHAHVVSATPGPGAVLPSAPLSLTLEFDAALADSGNRIALYRADRTAVGSFSPSPSTGKPPRLQTDLPALAPGVYTVAWTSVSTEDGHSLSQFYAFTVGTTPAATPPPALPPLQVGDTLVSLTATRGDVGPVAFHAVVQDATGKPVSNLQRVILRYQPVGLDIGEAEVIAPTLGGDAQTPAFTLGLAGAWQFQVIVRRAGVDDVSATTRLTIAPAPGAASAPAANSTTAPLPPPGTVAASPTPTLATPATPTTAASATSTIQPIQPTPASPPTVETAGTGSPDPVLIVAGLAVLVVVLGLVAFVQSRRRG